jgi:single-stranded DNA-binding protein
MLTSRKYTDKDNNNRTAIEVVADEVTFLNSKTDSGTAPNTPSTDPNPYNATGAEFTEFVEMTSDTDLPF